MKNKKIIILAVAFGLLTSYLVYDYLVGIEKRMTDIRFEEVVIAAADIPGKTLLTPEMLQVKKIPTDYIHPQALREADEAAGSITVSPLVQGEQVLRPNVARPGEGKNGLAFSVPPGKRAMAVPVDEVSGIAGMIRPGDRVDVVTVVNIPLPNGPPYAVVALQDIQVLAVGRQLEGSGARESDKEGVQQDTVTLAVTVEESRSLALCSAKGAIRLILHSPVDRSIKPVGPFKAENYLY